MFSKALALPADALILDLEDSVVPENKAAVRAEVCAWLGDSEFGTKQKFVRINPLDSEWGRDDMEAIVAAGPDGIVLPKVEDYKMIVAASSLAATAEANKKMSEGATEFLLIATESASAVFNLESMAQHPRVTGMSWGAEDLAVSLGARRRRDDDGEYLPVFQQVRSLCLLAAVASGVQPLDAVFTDVKNHKGLEAECGMAADMGFTGKLTIHPDQIEIVNRAFTPDELAINEARELVAAFEEHGKSGKMAFMHKGQMVDVPHLKQAKKVLELAAHISGQTS